MNKLSSLHTVLALAALAGTGGVLGSGGERVASRDWCARCQQRGKHVAITRSVTGARYCHGCGFFESKHQR